MMHLARIAAGIVGLLALALAANYMRAGYDLIVHIIQAVLVTGALFLLWFAAAGHLPSERAKIARTLLIGVIVGAIGFAAGFFGPLIVAPSAQGPLFGIFVSGPLGFVIGCIGGFFWTRLVAKS